VLILLSQAVPADPNAAVVLDWKHYALMALVAVVGVAVQWWNAGGKKILLDRIASSGHPQAAQTIALLVDHFAANSTPEEKQALLRDANQQGISHPAITEATK